MRPRIVYFHFRSQYPCVVRSFPIDYIRTDLYLVANRLVGSFRFFRDFDWRLCSTLLVMINLQHSGGSEYDLMVDLFLASFQWAPVINDSRPREG